MDKLTAKQELEETKIILADILKLSKSIIRNMRKITQIAAKHISDSSVTWRITEEEDSATYTFIPKEKEKKE